MSQYSPVFSENAIVSPLRHHLYQPTISHPTINYTAVQECRDRALPDESNFAGLAGIEHEDGTEVHTLDDGHEAQEHIKITGPRASPSSTPRLVESASGSNLKTALPTGKAKPHVQIKFGPPKGPKTDEARASKDISVPASQSSTSALVSNIDAPTASIAEPFNAAACLSRGPTPPISRPPTPVLPIYQGTPLVAIVSTASTPEGQAMSVCATSMPSFSVAPAVAPSRAAMPHRFASAAPMANLSRSAMPHRAASAQPAPSTWTGFSATTTSLQTPSTKAAASSTENGATQQLMPISTNGTYSAPPPGSIAVPTAEDLHLIQLQCKGHKRKGAIIEGNPNKQRKTSEGKALPSSSNTSATSHPEWLSNSLSLFKSTTLGPEWDLLVSNWFKFEEGTQFQGNGRLGCRRRPRVIAMWIKNARNPTFHPDRKDVKAIADDFTAWWQSLQPKWRSANSNKAKQPNGDWDCIRCSGSNGVLSVVAALFFWGDAVQNTPARTTWLEAMEDVSYVLAQLL